jgi:hypothetical protein
MKKMVVLGVAVVALWLSVGARSEGCTPKCDRRCPAGRLAPKCDRSCLPARCTPKCDRSCPPARCTPKFNRCCPRR